MEASKIIGIDDLKDKNLWRMLIAEFLGTFLLVALGILSMAVSVKTVQIAFAFGLAAAAAIQGIRHVSGGHINPSVTVGFMVLCECSILKGLLYILLQCLGGLAASAAVIPMVDMGFSSTLGISKLGVTMLAKSVSVGEAIVIEILITFVLVFVVKASTDPEHGSYLAPLFIGLSITGGHLAGINHTGSSMNSARSLGPAVMHGYWENHYVYWVGPMIGGMLGALVYKFVMQGAKGGKENSE